MEDYPRTIADLEARFSTEESCRNYLFNLRWPDGFQCPRCGHKKAWPVRNMLYQCGGCGYQASVIAGTIFENTHKPLVIWFRAIWWLVTQKNGASALGLKRILGLGSYKTAWSWLHKIRRAMVRPGRDRLFGRVEVDETFLGGPEEGVRGRKTFKKALIVVAAEEKGKAIGRIRMVRIPDASAINLRSFIVQAIEPGSTIVTDGWEGYTGLEAHGYTHEIQITKKVSKESDVKLLPRVHRVVSLLKRWVLGTHQGAVSPEHLDYYLDEFTFRFNRRTSRHRGKLFYRLLQQAMAVKPVPYSDMIKHVRGPGTQKTQDIVGT
jgi:transposase-like protein